MRTLLLAVPLLGLAAAAAEAPKNADLEKAQKALAAKKYPDALKAIEAAEKKGGLDLDSYSTLLESKALALASTKKLPQAEEAFKTLLTLDPRRDLAGKYKGDVVKALEAALAWVNQNGGLQVVALEPGASGGKVKQVSVSVKNDPLKLAKTARIYLKQGDGTWKPVDVAVNNGVAAADTDAAEVEYWAELQDANKNQLKFLGSALRPQKATAPPVVAEAPPPPKKEEKPVAKPVEKPVEKAPVAEAPVKEEEPKLTPRENEGTEATVTEDSGKGGSVLRPVSYAVLGAAIIAAGVGVYFGATSEGAKSSIRMDQMSMTFTAQQLYDRDQARIGQAQVANGMFITAAVAAVIGVVLFVLGG